MAAVTAPPQIDVRWTASDYLVLPDDGKLYEVLNGELLTAAAPNLRHQEVTLNLTEMLRQFVRERKSGRVYISPVDVVLGDDLVEPDVIFVSNERSDILGEMRITGAPDLVVEVLSLSTAWRDLRDKWDIYAKNGVSEYWIVNPAAETVTVQVLKEGSYETIAEAEQAEDVVESEVLAGFRATVGAIFA